MMKKIGYALVVMSLMMLAGNRLSAHRLFVPSGSTHGVVSLQADDDPSEPPGAPGVPDGPGGPDGGPDGGPTSGDGGPDGGPVG